MSFKEISTWIFLLLFGALAFAYAQPLIAARTLDAGHPGAIIGFVIAFVVLFAIAHIVMAVLMPRKANEAEDERDHRIELLGERAGGFALGAAVFFGLAMAMISGDRLYAHIFFLGLVASEIVKAAWQVALYRRGA